MLKRAIISLTILATLGLLSACGTTTIAQNKVVREHPGNLRY